MHLRSGSRNSRIASRSPLSAASKPRRASSTLVSVTRPLSHRDGQHKPVEIAARSGWVLRSPRGPKVRLTGAPEGTQARRPRVMASFRRSRCRRGTRSSSPGRCPRSSRARRAYAPRCRRFLPELKGSKFDRFWFRPQRAASPPTAAWLLFERSGYLCGGDSTAADNPSRTRPVTPARLAATSIDGAAAYPGLCSLTPQAATTLAWLLFDRRGASRTTGTSASTRISRGDLILVWASVRECHWRS